MVGSSAKAADNDRVRKKRELDGLLARDKEHGYCSLSGSMRTMCPARSDDARFAKMSKRYEQEQGENAGRIKVLRLELKKLEDKRMDVDAFLETVRPLHRRHHHYPSAWLPSSFSTSRFILRSKRTVLPISG